MKRSLLLPLLILLIAPTFADAKPAPARKARAARAARVEPTVVIDDVVRRIEPAEFGYRVFFKRHAAVYKVVSGSPNENVVMQALSASDAAETRVRVRAGATSLEIKELAVKK